MADFQGIFGAAGIETIVGGTNVTIDNTDPANPIINVSGIGSIAGWTPSANTASPNNTKNASRLLVASTSTDGDAVIQPKGAGAILGNLPDAGVGGGNKRGNYAIDLQLLRSSASFIAAGASSVVVGGEDNAANSTHSAVLGGYNNASGGTYSFIGGGWNNLTNATSTVIAGGFANTVSSSYGTIGGGDQNTVGASYATVAGGSTNNASGQSSTIVGGSGNAAQAVASTILGGGSNVTQTNADYSVAHGVAAVTRRLGEIVHAAGPFAYSGDCQKETVILRYETTNNTPTKLTIDGTASYILSNVVSIKSSSAYSFRGLITAMESVSGISGMWEIKGGIKRLGSGSVALVGSPTITTLGDDSSGSYDITVDVDVANNALGITVTGLSALTVRWGATIDLMHVSYLLG